MAHSIPTEITPDLAADPRRSAELLVRNRLSELLEDDVTVLYSVPWLHKESGGPPVEGEADFVIVHPDRGILVVEVKGGGITRDRETSQWLSTARDGSIHKIKDPVGQARSCIHALARRLRNMAAPGVAVPWIGYVVAFPHTRADELPLPPELRREVVVFEDDMKWLDQRIDKAFEFWARDSNRRPSAKRLSTRQIIDDFSPPTNVVRRLGCAAREQAQEIFELTQQQTKAFEILRHAKRVAVSGCAGSGKTVVALEQAIRFAREGRRTLLTCFNRPLAEELQDAAADEPNLVVNTFLAFCETTAQRMQIAYRAYADHDDPVAFFNETLPGALLEALEAEGGERFDAILVDECQDFRSEWIALLELALASPEESRFYLFFDDNQQLYNSQFEPPDGMIPIVLNENLRNPKPIFELAGRYTGDEPAGASGPAGVAPTFIEANDESAMKRQLGKLLHRLVVTEGFTTDEIAVLTGVSVEKSGLEYGEKVGAYTLDAAADGGAVQLSSIYRFKGLERPAVVLVDIGRALESEPALLYVGITRASSHLATIGTASELAMLQGG